MKELWVLYFGWEALGGLLRRLSLSGNAGNILSWVLYIFISLIPVLAPGVWMWRKGRRFRGLDLLLILLAAYTFYLLYVFINPGLFGAGLPKGLPVEEMLPYWKGVYGGLWLSLLVSWVLLTWVHGLSDRKILDRKEFLYRGMGGLLTAAIVLLVLELLYLAGTELAGRLAEIQRNEAGTGMDILFAVLKVGTGLLSSGFLPVILYRIKVLLRMMEMTPFDEAEVRAAGRLADVSRMAVTASVLSSLIWNGALFLWSGQLSSVDYHWEVSLFPVLTAFGSLILARYLREAGEIRRENEMII